MTERRRREHAERHQMIISTARDLAESDGWDAVTTRRLAERIEYSQPVLYSHFHGKDEIVGAVALEGFTELTDAVRRALPAGVDTRAGVAAVAATYLDFAHRHPAVYDAMFSLNTGLPFADADTPPQLQEAFTVLLETMGAAAGDVEPALFTEVAWAALHGLATLTQAGRLPTEDTPSRVKVLVDRLVAR